MRPGLRYLVMTGLCIVAPAANAETLADAIALAYQSNPSLQSARAQLRALDESYVQARAGYRPTATFQLGPSYSKVQQTNLFGQRVDPDANLGAADISVTQPIYTGGATSSAVDAASATIEAQREALRSVEANVLQSVIQAYSDVRRDEQILTIYENELGVLQTQVDDARARQKGGEVTRTDVEQSVAQLDSTRAILTLAQGQLEVSRSEYAAAVGQDPGKLEAEPPLAGLPLTIDEAFEASRRHSATLLQAQLTEKASAARIAEAKANYGPKAEFTTTYGYTGALQPFYARNEDRALTAAITITVPILTGGLRGSYTRQAIETNNSDRINIELARRTVVQAVSAAWNTALANRASAISDDHAVSAARQYFSDTQVEYRVGQRSTLDVLVAEQTLRTAEITLIQAKHDAYVAEAALLNAVGRLEAGNLVKDIPLYDPARSFRRVQQAGALPWEGAVAAIDRLGAPGPGIAEPLSSPKILPHATLIGGPDIPADAPPSTSDPTTPEPHTTSPNTPPGLGADRGAPYAPAD